MRTTTSKTGKTIRRIALGICWALTCGLWSVVPAANQESSDAASGTVPLRPQDETWFPFLSGGSHGMPVDLSFLNKDVKGSYIPAGSHGFLTTKNGDFAFADGTPIRFWGFNCCAGAALGGPERAAELTEQMARVGGNLVRLHHIDSWFEPIMDYQHPDGTTQHLNPKSMRALDAFIAEARKRGIYVNLDPWVQRPFKKADGVEPYPQMGKNNNFGLHPYVYFDPRMQELIRRQWHDVWTHTNEFTGLAYKDDPAIVMTEVINEGLLHNFEGVKEPHYRKILEQRYEAWAKENGGLPLEKADLFGRNADRNNLRFRMHLHRTFYRESYDYLRSLGVKIPINMNNWGFFSWVLATQSEGDFMDRHHYYGGDQLGPGKGLGNVWTHHSVYSENGPFSKFAAWSLAGKPFVSSECGHHSPKTYRAAYLPGLAAMACFQGWDGFEFFGFSQSKTANTQLHPFGWESDPGNLISFALGALIFRRSDVAPAKETVAFELTQDEVFTLRWEDNFKNLFWSTPGFQTAIEEHRVQVCLPGQDAAALKPVKVLDAESAIAYKHTNTELRSDTGELWRDWKIGVGTIDAPRTQAAMGKLGESGKTWSTRDCVFDIATPFAMVAVSSLTDAPVAESNRWLVAAVARTENKGMTFSREGVTKPGTAPVIVEPVNGKIRVKTKHPSLTLHPLLSGGGRGATIPVAVKNGVAEIVLDGNRYKTITYEVTAP